MFDWFKKKKTSGADYSMLDSQDKVEAAARRGDLVPMLLMPEAFGGPSGGLNVVYVPAWAAEKKQSLDMGTILPLAEAGKISRYSAQPAYSGASFVPSSITVRAHDPGEFVTTIDIWS